MTFTWDIPKAENLEKQWRHVAPCKIGGPALKDEGGEFIPGMYLKPGYVITSRGCPNHCWFCQAWKNEGPIRGLPINEGHILLDNNILACSREHQVKVYEMLARQKNRVSLAGGLEAARLEGWHMDWLLKIKPHVMWFAYDLPEDYEALIKVSQMMAEAGISQAKHSACCYVLMGYEGDTLHAAEERLKSIVKLGYFPQALLYDDQRKDQQWYRLKRQWADKVLVGRKVKQILGEGK